VSDAAVFVVLVGVVLVAGVALGMLIVPRLERLSEAPDEEPGAGDDPARD
jgi:uncharacterized protein YneF (UPF0154 family)